MKGYNLHHTEKNGDECVTGGHPGLQTRVYGTNTTVDRFDSYTSPPPQVPVRSNNINYSLYYQEILRLLLFL